LFQSLTGISSAVLTQSRVSELLGNFKRKRIAIIGDLMVDKYVWGTVGRISPEAPVPIVEVETETERLGGAANVANNIQSLGADPLLIGVIGSDINGTHLSQLVQRRGCSAEGLIVDESRPTTIKTRVIAHNQHVVRIDSEHKKEISLPIQERILAVLQHNISSLDGIIIEDYNKGVVVRALIPRIVELARKKEKIVAVDPKFHNFFEYENVTVFKPNKKEAEEALGRKFYTEADVGEAGKELLKRLKARNVLLTRGEKGMSLFEDSGAVTNIPTHARRVSDVSGAGDTVIATLTLALASGATMYESSLLANYAAGVVVAEVGIVPIEPQALIASIIG
jgi:D-glycero-beta-D-manno-heptose-7-phosphate kinase